MSSESNNCLNLVLFILNIVVITNTDPEVFDILGHKTYYDFILFLLVVTSVFLVLAFLSCCGVLVNINNSLENNCLIKLIQLISIISIVATIISLYYFMGCVWHQDSTHSVLFYADFWKELAMNFSGHAQLKHREVAKWAYVMSDILVRIYSTLVIIFTIFLVPIMCLARVFINLENELPLASDGQYVGNL